VLADRQFNLDAHQKPGQSAVMMDPLSPWRSTHVTDTAPAAGAIWVTPQAFGC
jgi:hypothetical protein